MYLMFFYFVVNSCWNLKTNLLFSDGGLKEAHDIDVNESRQQLLHLRRLPLLNRDEDFVNFYRLSESLIESLKMDLYPHLGGNQSKSIPIRRKVYIKYNFKVIRFAFVIKLYFTIIS